MATRKGKRKGAGKAYMTKKQKRDLSEIAFVIACAVSASFLWVALIRFAWRAL